MLNEWTARELNAKPGDTAQLDFYLWDAAGGENGFRTVHGRGNRSDGGDSPLTAASRRVSRITEAESFSDWDPPFPLDLSRVRPQDEAYWKEYRTTPKAFLFYERA